MASDWPSDPNDVLGGLYGSIYAARASGGGSASNIWDAIRAGAASWAESVLSVTGSAAPTQAEIDAAAGQLLSGVTVSDVNRYNQIAGAQTAAHQNLQSQGLYDQIMGTSIFTPPWSTTAGNPAIPDRYRIRVLRSITVRGFTTIERQEWASYELEGPLTSVIQALAQADARFTSADYNVRASINDVLDYSIEQV